jgi:hypothetical protein
VATRNQSGNLEFPRRERLALGHRAAVRSDRNWLRHTTPSYRNGFFNRQLATRLPGGFEASHSEDSAQFGVAGLMHGSFGRRRQPLVT